MKTNPRGKGMARLLWFFLVGALAGGQTFAAPAITNVSGAFTHGATVTVSGSGFGANTANQEWTGANIEAGTAGVLFAKSGWSGMNDWSPVQYAADSAHSGAQSLKVSVDTADNWNGLYTYAFADPVNPGDVVYLSWWVRANSTAAGQWKMLRLSQNDTVVDGSQEYVLFNWNDASGSQRVIDPGTGNDQTLWNDAGFPSSNQTWQRVELAVFASGANQSNGHSVLGKYDGTGYESYDWTGNKNFTTSGQQYNYALFQNYLGNGITGTVPLWFDDHFIQNGLARVELCNSSTWVARNHCEAQPRTSWGEASVGITLNQGSFSDGAAAYLYVVDATGAVNATGYPVTVGGAPDTTPPAPSGLGVQ